MENVKAIMNSKNLPDLDRWIRRLTDLGYTSSLAVLNAKDYGVPQNRERCFMVSSLGGREFVFPDPCPDGRVLRDVLEENVDECFFMSPERVASYDRHRERHKEMGHGFGWRPTHGEGVSHAVTAKPDRHCSDFIIVLGNLETKFEQTGRVHDPSGLSPTITTCQGGGIVPKIEVEDFIRYPSATAKGYMEAREGDGLVMTRPLTARGTVQKASSPTLTTGGGCGTGVVDKGYRIRYLTPLECWRLQGFPDSAYEAAKAVPTSKTQLYKQAGNSIAVPCLKEIFKGMYIDMTWKRRQTLDAWIDG